MSRRVPFKPTEKIGDSFVIPVKLQFEGGFSYGASGDGAYQLGNSVAGRIAKAKVDATQIVLRSQIDYESAFKAASGGKQAFQDVTQATVENMMESFAKRQELAILYGQSPTGLGAIGTVTVSGNATITFTAATWSPGIWVGMESHNFDAWNSTTKINTNALLTLVSVNTSASQIVVSGNASDLSALAAGHFLSFAGALSGFSSQTMSGNTYAAKEMVGLDQILQNTGTLFGISATSYQLWKSTSYASGGAISMGKTLLAVAQAVPLGLKEDTMALFAAKRWANLNNDLAALRRLDESYKSSEYKNGVEGISYHGVSGKLEVICHPFVKEGEALILAEKRLKRVGSTDVTFKRPNNPNNIFREIDQAAGFELRAYSDQQIFNEAPSFSVKVTGITD